MQTLHFTTGGYPLSIETLQYMQECWTNIYRALSAITGSGDFVVSGIRANGIMDFSIPGWIVLNGELLPYVSAKNIPIDPRCYACVIEDTTLDVGYENGETHKAVTRRYATTYTIAPANAVYSVQWNYVDTSNIPMRNILALSNQKVDSTDFTKALSRIATLEQQIAALGGSAEANLDALRQQLVPRGAIIAWSQDLPLKATDTDAVIKGMGDAYGYLPCGSWQASKDVINAWNGYIQKLGIMQTFSPNGGWLNFTSLLNSIGLKAPDTAGRFLLGSNDRYTLGATGGEAEHTLRETEMPSHSHSINARYCKVNSNKGSHEYHLYSDDEYGDPKYDIGRGRSTNRAGNGAPHNNMPPYTVINYLIKVI